MAEVEHSQLTIAGACGLTIHLPVNGVEVQFTCSPSGQAPIELLRPEAPGSGNLALFMPSEDALVLPTAARWLQPDYFAVQSELDPRIEPMVVTTSADQQMNVDDWMDRLGVAKDEHRAVVVQVGSRG